MHMIIYCYSTTLRLIFIRFRKLRERDASKYHVQLSLAMLAMYVVFASGVTTATSNFGGCVFVSVLIHYFSLAVMMWIAAEALLMFQKLVIVFVQITTKFIVILSLVCWCKFADRPRVEMED